MKKTIPFPSSIKSEITKIAHDRNYPVVMEIMGRGTEDELLIESREEAQAIVNVARIEMINAELKYPFWDEDSPQYQSSHEDAFQEVQMGLFEKVVMYLGQEFQITSAV